MLTLEDLKNIRALIERVSDIKGIEVFTVANLVQKLNQSIAVTEEMMRVQPAEESIPEPVQVDSISAEPKENAATEEPVAATE